MVTNRIDSAISGSIRLAGGDTALVHSRRSEHEEMSHREGHGLPEHQLEAWLQQVEIQNKQHVIEAQRQNMRVAELEVGKENAGALERAQTHIQHVRTSRVFKISM